ncbi:MAG: Crp/Fnr family transcriptional regulator [Sphingomonas sp.]|uniref:Crp/Fnr family transcriptional regulator n=1 Tax=Sphingomonas sp. TaxID=28214 RepID=UPI0025E28791|nr:Crp/Fnr family transcriptional regulator [Sphingomonas sp.]MBX3565422.1 Crp/Fnr family transcriptional regulator [Sphingomonas sp.]
MPLIGAFFADLPAPLLTLLFESGVRRAYAPGEALFHEEDLATQLFAITEGHVRVWRTSPRGAAMTVHVLGPGDLPGASSVVQRTNHPATASAVTAVKTLAWPAERALSMLFENPPLAFNTMRFLSQGNEEMLQRLHEVSSQPVEQRVARALLRLIAQGGSHMVEISRQELAELTATTLHTVSRIVSRWEAEGMVRAARRRILALKIEALEGRAGNLLNGQDRHIL